MKLIFFEKTLVKDENNDAYNFGVGQITATTSGRGLLVLGDTDGFIHLVDRQLQISDFQAYQVSVTHLLQSRVLISVGNDEEGIAPVIKVWNCERYYSGGLPQLLRTIKVPFGNSKPVPVSTIAVHEDLTHLAIGLTNGTVLLIKGDISRDRFSSKAPRVVHEGKQPVTGLGFRQEGKEVVLFIATSEQVLSYFLSRGGRNDGEILDESGCELGCAVMSDLDKSFIIGRTECLYSFLPEGRGAALVFEGDKRMLHWFRNYLVIVGSEKKHEASGAVSRNNNVTIYDTRNKFVAFVAGFNDVTYINSEWGSLFILCGDGKLYQLVEKDFQSKLRLLFGRHMYEIAINLAKTQQSESSEDANDNLVEIYNQYASHLYGKGNYNDAIQQYIKTIGKLEPSYVIRKFLDSQRIHNLTAYLQALHEKDLADKHHTTLLLNCYTKLKDVQKLDEFIRTERHLNFDLETAIKVCRQAGYYEHALYLAKKFKQHDWYMKIQLEDQRGYMEALQYIEELPFKEAEKNLKAYGKDLVNQLPEKTTEILIRLCTEFSPEDSAANDEPAGKSSIDDDLGEAIAALGIPKSRTSSNQARPEEFIHIYVNQIPSLLKFLEHMIARQPDCAGQVYDTLLELYLRAEDIDSRDLSKRKERDRQILDLLRSPNARYDDHHAMVLSQIYDFKLGILYLHEKARQYQQIVQYYMEKDAYHDVIEACKKYGAADRNLWVQALSYFAGRGEECRGEIVEVLTHIDKRNLLPPLMVIDALARNSTATLSVVKEYITRRLQQENQAIADDESTIREYRTETERMRTKIEELKTTAKVFQDMRCSTCHNPLDLPAVHFLCGHSYHQRCLDSDVEECSKCADERNKVMEIVNSQNATNDEHEQFFKQLDGAHNRFGVVAEYFGRGVFNKVTMVTDVAPKTPLSGRRGGGGGSGIARMGGSAAGRDVGGGGGGGGRPSGGVINLSLGGDISVLGSPESEPAPSRSGAGAGAGGYGRRSGYGGGRQSEW